MSADSDVAKKIYQLQSQFAYTKGHAEQIAQLQAEIFQLKEELAHMKNPAPASLRVLPQITTLFNFPTEGSAVNATPGGAYTQAWAKNVHLKQGSTYLLQLVGLGVYNNGNTSSMASLWINGGQHAEFRFSGTTSWGGSLFGEYVFLNNLGTTSVPVSIRFKNDSGHNIQFSVATSSFSITARELL